MRIAVSVIHDNRHYEIEEFIGLYSVSINIGAVQQTVKARSLAAAKKRAQKWEKKGNDEFPSPPASAR